MNRRNGFTMIELMIVIAIIILIAAIAIPSLMRSRISANEAGASSAIRSISTAEIAFQAAAIDKTTSGTGKYGTLAQLGSGDAPFLDPVVASGVKNGYTFQATPTMDGEFPRYTATALPLQAGGTGIRSFYVDESSMIRFESSGGTPTSASTPFN